MKKTIVFTLMITLLMTSCSKTESKKAENLANNTILDSQNPNAQNDLENYDEPTINDTLAQKIKTYLTNQYLKREELNLLTDNNKKFQLYEVDLNNDSKKEIFVNLSSPYFCGSGGCTILLLSSDLKQITTFTVTKTPIFAEPTFENGWKRLMVKSEGNWRNLVYTNGSYPSNPSIAPKSTYNAPSGDALVIFSEQFPAKTYSY
ncbi:hypothetical protein [Chryseobacterium fistulae]|uniref:Lipoprotein n=1 Tax=Chryseobacterium fistulae TaxID=2675058 RepID=A0A6N4XNQ5_9FLAO|nr:hypothetical protein [Chryseobacterium fistulae]CAA7386301.1 hypothetical protein CHRY9393_00593 [Chryseobacterium fistulae]